MSEVKITKTKVFSSFIWSILEKFSSQGLQFILSIILARILLPEDYGIVALIQIFIQIANVFVIDGFNTALIQKKDSDDLDFSSVFYFTCFLSLFLFIGLYFLAPVLADFYNQPKLVGVTRIFALSFFYTPIASCQYAYIDKHLQFKVYLLRSIICLIVSGTISVILAYKGFGVYALVIQQLSYGILNTIILWFSIEWRPKLMFSISRIKNLFSYGWKILCTGLLENIFRNIYGLIIGKAYDSVQLGYYNRGMQFPNIIAVNFVGALKGVVFPTFSSNNDNINEVKNMLRRASQVNAYILLPCMLGMAAVSKSLVLVLLTDKWIDCVPFLQLSCFYFALYNINATSISAVNAIGRSDVYLKYEIIKKILIILSVVFTIPLGVIPMLIGQIVVGLISSILNMLPCKKYLNYKISEQIKDLMPSFLASLVMFSLIYLINSLNLGNFITLVIQIFSGALIYIVISMLFKIEGFYYILNTIKARKMKSN